MEAVVYESDNVNVDEDEVYRITTIDNPFDPFTEFQRWFIYDSTHGYDTCGKLDRICLYHDGMSDVEKNRENNRAIKELIKYDLFNIYKRVKKPTNA